MPASSSCHGLTALKTWELILQSYSEGEAPTKQIQIPLAQHCRYGSKKFDPFL
jgi:hypothetical protein